MYSCTVDLERPGTTYSNARFWTGTGRPLPSIIGAISVSDEENVKGFGFGFPTSSNLPKKAPTTPFFVYATYASFVVGSIAAP